MKPKKKILPRRFGNLRKITGLWQRRSVSQKQGRNFDYLKSGRIEPAGFENMQAFGDKTVLMVLKRRKSTGHPNQPDYFLVAAEDWGTPVKEIFWDDLPESKK